jgi:hypothetical protein
VDYVNRKEDPLIDCQNPLITASAALQTSSRFKLNYREEQDNKGRHRRENKRKMVREEDA